MKNKIYPFLLGLSCIVIVALVSFKNSEKVVEKEQMIIMAKAVNARTYEIFISTSSKYEKVDKVLVSTDYNYSDLLQKIEEYQKQDWKVTNSMSLMSTNTTSYSICYTLEREKK